jgi:transmembrane sensor
VKTDRIVGRSMDRETIETSAARWVMRHHSESWTEADQQEFDAWLEESTSHRVAYIRLDVVWQQTGRLKALGAGVPAGVIPSARSWNTGSSQNVWDVSDGNKSPARAHIRRWLALAASVVLPVLAAVCLIIAHMQGADQYATAIGGLKTVKLADGSEVTLNTATRIRVYLRSQERRIDLASGEAYFVVAKDPSRPFVVNVADKSVTAVGTQFSMRRSSREIQVLVTEGQVQLRSSRTVRSGLPMTLDAGTVARTIDSEVLVRRPSEAEAEQLLSWRSGFVVFRDTPLEDAVAELNRYQAHKLVIADRSIAAIRIGGKFRYANLDAFLSLLQQGFPVTVEQAGDHITLKRRI